jgi:2-hydroxychromene-2-carboxylate isomerase
MSIPTFEFWYEFASTYSYVAAMQIEEAAEKREIPVTWKPFLLGPLFRKQGWTDSPFNLFGARGRYMWRDIERRCRKNGLKFKRPASFPKHSLLPARVAIAASDEPWMQAFSRAVYMANFVEDQDISDRDLISILVTEAGGDAEHWLNAAVEPANKLRLREQTERAWELGVFGAPTLIVDGELFWGGDRMEDAFDWYEKLAAGA